MTGTLLPALVLAACVAMLVRMALAPRRREHLDARLLAGACAVRRVVLAAVNGLRRGARRAYRWRSDRRAAERAADEAIRRARRDDDAWDGNVAHPKAFRKKPPGELH